MKVIILGGGTVGSTIAEMLCNSRHTVTLIDSDPVVAKQLDQELDIRVIVGSASRSSILFQAGVTSADLCLAMTGCDECNLVSASIAKAMGTKRVVARVYAKVFRDLSTFDYQRHFNIDRLLNIEYLSAMELARRIREPGAILIEHFARGELEMQDVVISRSSSSTGIPLVDLQLPSEVRIGTISRDGNVSLATADDVIEPGDRISILGSRDAVEDVKKRFHTQSVVKQNIIIAGGGETGYHLAQVLQNRGYKLTVIEADEERCEFLSSHLKNASIIRSDARRKIVLEEERVGNADVFVGCIGDDENNIMACVEAQELGAKKLVAVINRPDYANVIGKLGIDETVSPREVMARQVEGFLHTGPLVFQNSHLLGGGIDVLELEVGKNSLGTLSLLKDLALPKQSLLATFIRDSSVMVPGANTQFKEGDSLVALAKTSEIPFLEKIFQAADDN